MRLRRFFFFVSPLVDENENFVGILFFKLEDWKVKLKLKKKYIYIMWKKFIISAYNIIRLNRFYEKEVRNYFR